jgi:hypothetical protein
MTTTIYMHGVYLRDQVVTPNKTKLTGPPPPTIAK